MLFIMIQVESLSPAHFEYYPLGCFPVLTELTSLKASRLCACQFSARAVEQWHTKMDVEVAGRTFELYHFLKTSRKIRDHSATEEIFVSQRTVCIYIGKEARKDQRKVIKKKTANPPGHRLLRNKRFINKVAKALDNDDPPCQRPFKQVWTITGYHPS